MSLQWRDGANHDRTAVGVQGVYTIRLVGETAFHLRVVDHDGLDSLHLPPGGRQYPNITDVLRAAETIDGLPAEAGMSGS